jgi:hypothetical protein
MREHADESWEVIRMPAIAEVDDDFRKAGEALWSGWGGVGQPVQASAFRLGGRGLQARMVAIHCSCTVRLSGR